MIFCGSVAVCLFTFVGTSRSHLFDSTAFLWLLAAIYRLFVNDYVVVLVYSLMTRPIEICMGIGKTGIPWVPWDSHGNGNTISHGMGMEWEWD